MKRKRVWVWVAMTAVVALFAASAGSAGAGVPSQATKGVTSSTINVAGMVSNPTFGDTMEGAQARFDGENANGGVFGRKIKIVDTADDKFDPTTNVQEDAARGELGQRVRDRPDGDGGARFVRLPRPAEGALLRMGHLLGILRERLRLRLHGMRGAEDAGVRQHLHARGRRQGAEEGPEGSDRGDHR